MVNYFVPFQHGEQASELYWRVWKSCENKIHGWQAYGRLASLLVHR